MDDLQPLRDLMPARPVGDEDAVRQAAQARLGEAIAGHLPRGRAGRAWVPRLAVGLGVAGLAAVMAVSFLRSDRTPASHLPGPGLYEAVGTVVQEDGWSAPRACSFYGISERNCDNGPEIVGWDWPTLRRAGIDAYRSAFLGAPRRNTRVADAVRLVGHFADGRFVLDQPVQQLALNSLAFSAWGDERIAACNPAQPPEHVVSQRLVEGKLMGTHDQSFTWPDASHRVRVINVLVRDNASAAIQRIRAVYSGPLCMVEGQPLGDTTMLGAFRDLEANPDPLNAVGGGGLVVRVSPAGDSVAQLRTYDDGSFQARLNKEFGPGRVRVQSLFRPYDPQTPQIDRFWRTFGWGNALFEWKTTYHSLAELRAAASLVVRGRLDQIDPKPAKLGPGLYAVHVSIDVTTDIGGAGNEGKRVTVQVELPGATDERSARGTINTLRTNLVTRDVVAFLARVDATTYRPLNDVGLWAATGRARVDAPLAPMRKSGRFLSDTFGIETLDQLVDAINYVGKFRTIAVP